MMLTNVKEDSKKSRQVPLRDFSFGSPEELPVIAGPCVIESERSALAHAERLKKITGDLGVPFVFKSSYDKANRSSFRSFRGPGAREGLRILKKVKETLDIPVLSDVHSMEEVGPAAEVLDILQIPAFLCRQTDLILEVARTKRIVNVKKGQFLAPWDVINIVQKIESTGNRTILLTERGTSFGYNALVNDFRSIPIMKSFGYPVVFDTTHSVQQPGGLGSASGGEAHFIPTLARCAVAAGCDAVFMEVHENPKLAKSDGPNSLRLRDVRDLLEILLEIKKVVAKVPV